MELHQGSLLAAKAHFVDMKILTSLPIAMFTKRKFLSMNSPSRIINASLSGTPSLDIQNPTKFAMVVTLNRPKALNALDIDMCTSVRDMLLSWRRKGVDGVDVPHVFIMKGAGGKAFCAGGDVKSIWQEIVALHPQSVPADDLYIGSGRPGKLASDFFRLEYQMNYLLGTSLIPQISLWDGIVMGGGVGVSVLGSFRIATEKTVFAMPETAIGLFPDVGSSGWLPHLKSGYGNFIGLTGQRLSGMDLLYAGIATHYVQSSKLPDLEREIISVVAEDYNESKRLVKEVLKQYKENFEDEQFDQCVLKKNEKLIKDAFEGAESVEKIVSVLRTEGDKGDAFAQNTLQTLLKHSPTSLKVTLDQLKIGSSLDLKHCLEMEYRLMNRCIAANDFREGIRAVLIDKDNKPNWSPKSLKEVSEESVKKYFEPLKEFELNLDFNVE